MDDTVAIWCRHRLARSIQKEFLDFPFKTLICKNTDDICALPYFLLIVDGNLLEQGDRGIDLWSCYLLNFSAKGKKCPRCKTYIYCVEDAKQNYDPKEPKYPNPVILLNPDKRKCDVDGMFAIIPPMPTSDIPNMEFFSWLRKEVFEWYRKAGEWRKQFDLYQMHKESKNPQIKESAIDIAKWKWSPRNIELKIQYPEFEDSQDKPENK